jgi:hypothetical protein
MWSGDLIRRGRERRPAASLDRLAAAYIHLKAYEAQRGSGR